MYEINTLYTLNLHNVIHQIYSNEKIIKSFDVNFNPIDKFPKVMNRLLKSYKVFCFCQFYFLSWCVSNGKSK